LPFVHGAAFVSLDSQPPFAVICMKVSYAISNESGQLL